MNYWNQPIEEKDKRVARMKKRVGESRWVAHYFEKLHWDEHVFRTARKPFGYLVEKNCLTWGKKSKKHFDYGWLDHQILDWHRHKFLLYEEMPYSKTKLGALRLLLANLRENAADYGGAWCEDYEGTEDPEPSIDTKIKRVLAAIKKGQKK